MFTAKPELCTGLALRFKTASFVLPNKQFVPEVSANNALCVYIHVCIPESSNVQSLLFSLLSLDSVPVRQG